jgi:hypothetical protein
MNMKKIIATSLVLGIIGGLASVVFNVTLLIAYTFANIAPDAVIIAGITTFIFTAGMVNKCRLVAQPA